MKKIIFLILPALFIFSYSNTYAVVGLMDTDNNDSLNHAQVIKDRNCTTEYAPVCGIDQITYGNPCMADTVEISFKGECKEKISGPSQIKYYKNIYRYGINLFGDKMEKISGPSQIKYYKNIVKIGSDLYGYKK